MNQYSHEGTAVEVELLSGHLLLIDPLYLSNIKEEYEGLLPNISALGPIKFLRALEDRFFPYGGGTLLGYLDASSSNGSFHLMIDQIKYFDHNHNEDQVFVKDAVEKRIPVFATDFGGILLLDLYNFHILMDNFSLDDLVDVVETDDTSLTSFVQNLNSIAGNKGWAYIHNPSIGQGFDFIGSGSYRVEH